VPGSKLSLYQVLQPIILIAFREATFIFSDILINQIHALREQNAECMNVKPGVSSYHLHLRSKALTRKSLG
jgi:hypothetical protein